MRDGGDENATLIGQYCRRLPGVIYSSYNYLWIMFQSDSSVTYKGFEAEYKTRDMGCGGILKQDAGLVKSPQYPSQYLTNANCTWVIVAPVGNVIQISWLMFHLEQSSLCTFDYVEIFDNNTRSGFGGSLGKFCGNTIPPVMISTSNVMSINFVTDPTVNLDGFMANYFFVNENHGKVILIET